MNDGWHAASLLVTNVTVEELACPEHACDKLMTVETDYMPRLTHWDPRFLPYPMNTTVWYQDPDYWNPYDGNWQGDTGYYVTLLKVAYPVGPDIWIPAQSSWDSLHVLELCHDSEDEERQTLARRHWMRVLSPQGTENPIYWHLESIDNLTSSIDETVAAGFEMVIMSYNSGFNAESSDPAYIKMIRDAVTYAHSKGILIGGYTLMQNPLIETTWKNLVVDPIHGLIPVECFATAAHYRYRQRLIHFLNQTGVDLFETDGPYEGAPCSSTNHEYHHGYSDSQAAQGFFTQDFYRSLKVRDIYFTVPDPYWISAGTNKEPIGYTDEWSNTEHLDRYERLTIGRMYSYDGTYHYPPTMGWMAWNFENYNPLSNYTEYYEIALAQYLGNGIVTAFRGPHLYDSNVTLQLTRYWASFYKKHRTVLNADILHITRVTGQWVDIQVHAHPLSWPYSRDNSSTEIALGFLANPTPTNILNYRVRINLYYAAAVPGQMLALSWVGSQVRPFPIRATESVIVDESFSVDILVSEFPAYQFLFFIATA